MPESKVIAQPGAYRRYIKTLSTKDRLKAGLISAGIPSAFLTGLFSLPAGRVRAAKAAVGIGLLGTSIGAIATPKKKAIHIKMGKFFKTAQNRPPWHGGSGPRFARGLAGAATLAAGIAVATKFVDELID